MSHSQEETKMQMTYDAFLDSICHRGGFESAERAESVAQAVLCVLGEVLVDTDREALAEELPEALRAALCTRKPNRDYNLEMFYQRVGQEERLNGGLARETAQVVGRVLSRSVSPEVAKRIRRRLPEEYEELFVNPHEGAAAPERPLEHTAKANERTLARGKPGSEKPVSESKPVEGQPDSIAAQENPYGETKIATGHESTDEDEQTLAGGKPGSDRPLSDTHEE
ncbi:DUF2267 domain-containing protein [Persicimonas caeni]|uniref:DUF2267 domain-containing protein n=2 Tax=Persicimonas caeni TaxID=2292766 RepID=A0A4Y6PQS1_PERCE|nr:DUF2267 domain-containing protein [Persicimonas caeni]QED31680.1 DUF2267 domain-containing protein [Persicimonas caeni]